MWYLSIFTLSPCVFVEPMFTDFCSDTSQTCHPPTETGWNFIVPPPVSGRNRAASNHGGEPAEEVIILAKHEARRTIVACGNTARTACSPSALFGQDRWVPRWRRADRWIRRVTPRRCAASAARRAPST